MSELRAHPVFAPNLFSGLSLLEADAGTGKTWTIAGLVVRAIIEQGLGIEQILVVTFTRAASAELALRVRERIEQLARLLDDRLAGRESDVKEVFCLEWVARHEDEASWRQARDRLRLAQSRFDDAAIRTIHGYCQRIIDEHPMTTGVAVGARVSDSARAWVQIVVANWWRSELAGASDDIHALLALADINLESLGQLVAAVAARPGYALSPPAFESPEQWREEIARLVCVRRELGEAVRAEREDLVAWLAKAKHINRTSYNKRNRENWLNQLQDLSQGILTHKQIKDGRNACEKFTTVALSHEATEPIPFWRVAQTCDQLKELESLEARWAAMLVEQFVETARRERFSRGDIGSDDLLIAVHRALGSPQGGALAASLRRRYRLALVDECQDTDPLQADIFHRVYLSASSLEGDPASDSALVLVGDPKQAIYGFRGADIQAYLRLSQQASQCLRLDENQRSDAPMIEAVNALFDRPRSFRIQGVDFRRTRMGARARARLRCVAPEPAQPWAALTVFRLACAPGQRSIHKREASHRSLGAMVGETLELLSGRWFLDDEPLRASDIAFLVRTHEEGSQVKRALAAVGISAAEISRESVFRSEECDELIKWLTALAEPSRNAAVMAALAGSLFALDARAVCALREDGSAWDDATARLTATRDEWARRGAARALRGLVIDAGVAPRLAALEGGERRLTNLLHLVELIASDPDASRGPAQALQCLARLRNEAELDADAVELRLESDDDLVRIVTLHKSKGLEYPVVFLPFSWLGTAIKRESPVRAVHPPQASAEPPPATLDLRPDKAAQDRAAEADMSERLRLFYVALTRARHRCYLSWGPADGAAYTPLAWLLHGVDAVPLKKGAPPGFDEAQAIEALERWAAQANAASAGAVALRALGEAEALDHERSGVRFSASAPTLSLRAPSRPIPPAARQTSFSGLALALGPGIGGAQVPGEPGSESAEQLGERPEHDEAFDPPVPPSIALPEVAASVLPVRFEFPAGNQAGVCLHGMLEDHRLGERIQLESVARRLADNAYPVTLAGPVCQWLEEVLATPLPAPAGLDCPPVRLDQPLHFVSEMDFLITARSVDTAEVIAAIRQAGHAIEGETAAQDWSGLLRGFIDLVYESHGRWWLLDWKSNLLGTSPADYGQSALERSIAGSAYALQFCLYTLALHRQLRLRLAGYDYERHVGGVHYLYLRGVGPGLVDDRGAPLGVYTARPSRELIDRLDQLFGTPA